MAETQQHLAAVVVLTLVIMSMIALITDFGQNSFYVGVLKATLYHTAPDARVVDISHDISPHRIEEGSFILETVFDFFPEGTVFLSVVDPGVGGDRKNLIFEIEKRYVVAPDNGLVTDLSVSHPKKSCFWIEEERLVPYRLHRSVGKTFLGRDIFAPAAGAIASGMPPNRLGKPLETFEVLDLPAVQVEANRIRGCGRYIDRFGNILTNITKTHLKKAFGGELPGRIRSRIGEQTVEGIHRCYTEKPPGTLLVVLGSWDLVEVSVNQGRAADKLSITDSREMRIVIEI